MNKTKLELINVIINDLDDNTVDALYEILIENHKDYVVDLFENADEFRDFIETFKSDCKCGEEE